MSTIKLYDSATAVLGGIKVSCLLLEDTIGPSSAVITLPMTTAETTSGGIYPEKSPGISEISAVMKGYLAVGFTPFITNAATYPNKTLTVTSSATGFGAVLVFSFD